MISRFDSEISDSGCPKESTKFYFIQPRTLVMMALVNSLNMYCLSDFGFANGIFSFDQLYIGSECRIAYLSLPSSLEEPSMCDKVIDSSICFEKYHSSNSG